MTPHSTYDVESYPNFFSATFLYDRKLYGYEISWRRNDIVSLITFLDWSIEYGIPHQGFNNLAYDYTVIDAIYEMFKSGIQITAYDIYLVNDKIISTPWERRFDNIIPEWKHRIKQIDLMKINHFDNQQRSTSLKQLEFVMRANNIEDLPYPAGFPIPETDEAADTVMKYNAHDVVQTENFGDYCSKQKKFRVSLGERYERDFTNSNDTKIGKSYFVMKLNEAGIQTHEIRDGQRRPIQTWRSEINLGELILPYVQFARPEFQSVVNQIASSTITQTKGALSIKTSLDGFEFVFGLGGIHGSVEGETFYSDDELVVIDADVASYYPNIAIVNKIYPAHLSAAFCDVYQQVFDERRSYKKGTPENAAMKLALNGVYGDSNSAYSPFYDPAYTMATTINGQLMLCMLAEQLMAIQGCKMIQINTDGLTVQIPRKYQYLYDDVCKRWQQLTRLELEFVNYKSMHVRDVNNYIAVGEDGKKKFKGAYAHIGAHEFDNDDPNKLEWHKNHSALVVSKAAVAAILENIPVRKFITEHEDIFDFFKLAKVKRTEALILCDDLKWDDRVLKENYEVGQIQRISRYLVTNSGYKLFAKRKPIKRRTFKVQMVYPGWISKKVNGLNKNLEVKTQYEYENALCLGYRTKDGGTYTHTPDRLEVVEKGHTVTIYNRINGDEQFDINYEYYIREAEKLVNGVLGLK